MSQWTDESNPSLSCCRVIVDEAGMRNQALHLTEAGCSVFGIQRLAARRGSAQRGLSGAAACRRDTTVRVPESRWRVWDVDLEEKDDVKRGEQPDAAGRPSPR